MIDPRWMVGIDADSEGMKRAADRGLITMSGGADELLASGELPDLIFEATSAYASRVRAEVRGGRIVAIDLTPAAVGPAVVPPANLREHLDAPTPT